MDEECSMELYSTLKMFHNDMETSFLLFGQQHYVVRRGYSSTGGGGGRRNLKLETAAAAADLQYTGPVQYAASTGTS